MSTYTPDGSIRCENCNKFFNKYVFLYNVIDADSPDETSQNAVNGNVNRVTCPYCKTEFTYENPLMFHSYSCRITAVAAIYTQLLSAHKLSVAFDISGSRDWSLRRCAFARDAAEKIRIFKCGLNDAAIEIMKLKHIPCYRKLDLYEQYIVFDKISAGHFIFTLRDYTDEILDTYTISKCEYDRIPKINIPTARWVTIDRSYALKLEDTK